MLTATLVEGPMACFPRLKLPSQQSTRTSRAWAIFRARQLRRSPSVVKSSLTTIPLLPRTRLTTSDDFLVPIVRRVHAYKGVIVLGELQQAKASEQWRAPQGAYTGRCAFRATSSVLSPFSTSGSPCELNIPLHLLALGLIMRSLHSLTVMGSDLFRVMSICHCTLLPLDSLCVINSLSSTSSARCRLSLCAKHWNSDNWQRLLPVSPLSQQTTA